MKARFVLLGLAGLALAGAGSIVLANSSAKASKESTPKVSSTTKANAGAPVKTQPTAPQLKASQFEGLMGGQIDLDAYRGKVVLLVNTASQCGFTGQYAGLERLWKEKRAAGLVVIGVPSNDFGGQEPGSAGQIKSFCELNYGVTFPMTAKSVVRGPQAHPFYALAATRLGSSAVPAWNFHKILIGKDGQFLAAFPSAVTPQSPDLTRAIDTALARRVAS